MAKARKKTRRKKTASPQPRQEAGAGRASGKRGPKTAIYSLLLALAVVGGWFIWRMEAREAAFLDLAAANNDSLRQVRTMRNLGGGHLTPGRSPRYADPFPTSGPHAPVWTDPGVYADPRPDVQLVHALEHGNIVIYYDQPADGVFATLESWAGLYPNQWSGIVVTRKPGLGPEVVLTAWRRILRMKVFDAGAAAAFVDAYRGRGPENPVR